MDEKDRPTGNLENQRIEYQDCATLGRFFVGIRFTFFATFTTLFIFLIGGYHHIWSSAETFGKLQPYLLELNAVFGLAVTLAGWLIERRNIFLFSTCARRLAMLEWRMGIPEGINRHLISPEARDYFMHIPASHTLGIFLVYTAISAVWIMLTFYGACRIVLSLVGY